jgi:hypothetical protein
VRTEFFARASGQQFEVEKRKTGRLVGADPLAIEKTKRSHPAILLASDTIKEFPALQAEPRRLFNSLRSALYGARLAGLERVSQASLIRRKAFGSPVLRLSG